MKKIIKIMLVVILFLQNINTYKVQASNSNMENVEYITNKSFHIEPDFLLEPKFWQYPEFDMLLFPVIKKQMAKRNLDI